MTPLYLQLDFSIDSAKHTWLLGTVDRCRHAGFSSWSPQRRGSRTGGTQQPAQLAYPPASALPRMGIWVSHPETCCYDIIVRKKSSQSLNEQRFGILKNALDMHIDLTNIKLSPLVDQHRRLIQRRYPPTSTLLWGAADHRSFDPTRSCFRGLLPGPRHTVTLLCQSLDIFSQIFHSHIQFLQFLNGPTQMIIEISTDVIRIEIKRRNFGLWQARLHT